MSKFICKSKCQYKKTIFKIGDVVDVSTIVRCPACKGVGCAKCQETGRIDPPHHFESLEKKGKPAEIVDAPEADAPDTPDIDALRKIFEDNGIAFDRRWGMKKFQDELIKAEKEGKIK